MRIVVHQPTVEAPDDAARAAAVVLAAVTTSVRGLADDGSELADDAEPVSSGPRRP